MVNRCVKCVFIITQLNNTVIIGSLMSTPNTDQFGIFLGHLGPEQGSKTICETWRLKKRVTLSTFVNAESILITKPGCCCFNQTEIPQ